MTQSGPITQDVLIDDFPNPVFALDQENLTITWLNQSAQAWVGRSFKSVEGLGLDAFISNVEPIIEACESSLTKEAPVSLRRFKVKREHRPDLLCHFTIFPSGDYLGLSIVPIKTHPHDNHNKGESLSGLGRMLAHEIKNPLAGIGGAAQLLEDDIRSEEGAALLNLIKSEIGRVSRLVERMERLGDQDPKVTSAVNIHEVLRQARQVIQNAVSGDITFTEVYDPSLPDALGDADTLLQAILNLIKNASEAILSSNNSGEIRLETAYKVGVTRRLAETNQLRQLPIEIRIIDNGPGIADSIRNDIFQPFVTDKPIGQGLGLALVAKVVAAHEGVIEMTTTPGLTIFAIRLPSFHEENR